MNFSSFATLWLINPVIGNIIPSTSIGVILVFFHSIRRLTLSFSPSVRQLLLSASVARWFFNRFQTVSTVWWRRRRRKQHREDRIENSYVSMVSFFRVCDCMYGTEVDLIFILLFHTPFNALDLYVMVLEHWLESFYWFEHFCIRSMSRRTSRCYESNASDVLLKSYRHT